MTATFSFRIKVHLITNYCPLQTRSHQMIISVSAANESEALAWVKKNTDAYFVERFNDRKV